MAGLLGFLAAGAAKGVGTGIVERARAQREAALKELDHSRQLARDQANRDFERSERMETQAFNAREGALDRAATAASKPPRTFKAADGHDYYEDGTRVLPNVEKPRETFRPATPEEAGRYGAAAGQFGPDDRFYPADTSNGISFTSPDGTRVQVGGKGGGTFTEGQSKDNVFSTRARGALETLDAEGMAARLASRPQRLLDSDPTGYVRGALQDSDYQVARAAGEEFLQAILRKDTGAAITPDETALYGGLYLPQPGDGPGVQRYKTRARQRAIAAIEAGMSPAQMAAQERALMNSGSTPSGNESGSANYRQRYGLE